MNNEQPRPGLTVHCQEIVELVTDYLEGALDPEMTAEVEVRTLRRMRHHVEQLRTTVRALGRVPVESLTEDAQAELDAPSATCTGRPLPSKRRFH